MDIKSLMVLAIERKASDLHISSGEKPIIRVDGDLIHLDEPGVVKNDVYDMLKSIMNENQFKEYEKNMEYDFGYQLENDGRFRINAFHQSRGPSFACRYIPMKIPKFDELELDQYFKKLCTYPNGLVIITGPTGSGKSTTLAAMIDYLNSTKGISQHIITIEDPIEYLYKSETCLIQQREVGHDTVSFKNALRSALREDPDIILVGEMRDIETMRLALTAAETGHLVFATLHTSSAAKTVDRIIDAFPESDKGMVRTMLSESLRAVVAQTLLKRPEGGRIAVQEVMICTPAIRNLIREQKIAQIFSMIQTGHEHGMWTMKQHMDRLAMENKIDIPRNLRDSAEVTTENSEES